MITSVCRVKADVAQGTLPNFSDWFSLITITAEQLCGLQFASRSNERDFYVRFLWDAHWGTTWHKITYV